VKKDTSNILSSIKEGYYEVDIGGNIVFCNDALCEIIATSMAEIMGSSFRNYCTEA
jgi:PAS domain-containing protein